MTDAGIEANEAKCEIKMLLEHFCNYTEQSKIKGIFPDENQLNVLYHKVLERIEEHKPVQYINGSIIFLDYSDFEHQSQLYFMFNSFRIEVFGEMLQRNVPVTTNAFTVPTEDAQGCRNEISPDNILPQFSQLLEKYLHEHLDKLQREEFQTI